MQWPAVIHAHSSLLEDEMAEREVGEDPADDELEDGEEPSLSNTDKRRFRVDGDSVSGKEWGQSL